MNGLYLCQIWSLLSFCLESYGRAVGRGGWSEYAPPTVMGPPKTLVVIGLRKHLRLMMQMLRKWKWQFSLELSQVFSKNPLNCKDVEKIRNAFNYGLLDGNTLDHSNFLNRKKDDLGETLLHYYARSDNDPNVKIVYDLLLTNGANINCIDSSITPKKLHFID